MRCTNCNKPISSGYKFCPNCGNEQIIEIEETKLTPEVEEIELTPEETENRRYAVTAKIFGILSITVGLIYYTVPLAILAIGFGSLGKKCEDKELKKQSVFAFVSGIIMLIIGSVVFTLLMIKLFSD